MKLLGFSIEKISAERFSNDFKELKIENNIKIEQIQAAKADFLKKEGEAIQISFSYLLDYSPKVAKIGFSGNVLLLVEPKMAKEILKKWEEKKLSDEIKFSLFNFILRKTTIKALELEDELGLPLHVSLPSLKPQKKD